VKTFKQYEDEIVEVIKRNNLFIITDIFAYYTGCVRETFYVRKLNKSDNILKAIDDNKIKTCQSLKLRWAKHDAAPVLQIALFKTISTEDDLRRLSQSYNDHSSHDGTMSPKITVKFNDKDIDLKDV